MVARQDYLPFGEEIPAGYAGRSSSLLFGASDGVEQKFTGQIRDSETGLDFFAARYYGSALGRFTSPDPANAGADATDPQSWNVYAYVRNNPLALVDPMGLCHMGADNVAYDDEPGDCGGGSVTVVAQAPEAIPLIWVSFPSGSPADQDQQVTPSPQLTESSLGAVQPAKKGSCPAGVTPSGLTYSPSVQQHIERRHMYYLSNGAGAGSTIPSYNRNGVNVPASQYIFEPDGTPSANWQLVLQINAKTFSLATPVPSRGNVTFTAHLGPQNIPFPLARPFIGVEYSGWLNIFGMKFPFPALPTDVNTLVTKADCQTVVTSHPGNP